MHLKSSQSTLNATAAKMFPWHCLQLSALPARPPDPPVTCHSGRASEFQQPPDCRRHHTESSLPWQLAAPAADLPKRQPLLLHACAPSPHPSLMPSPRRWWSMLLPHWCSPPVHTPSSRFRSQTHAAPCMSEVLLMRMWLHWSIH